MPRTQNVHAYVNAGFCFKLNKEAKFTVLQTPTIVFGGISSSFVSKIFIKSKKYVYLFKNVLQTVNCPLISMMMCTLLIWILKILEVCRCILFIKFDGLKVLLSGLCFLYTHKLKRRILIFGRKFFFTHTEIISVDAQQLFLEGV